MATDIPASLSEAGLPKTLPITDSIVRPDPVGDYWQRKLLPFVLILISILTVFFLVVSVVQVSDITKRIEAAPALDLDKYLVNETVLATGGSAQQRLSYFQWKTILALEAHGLRSRYHQANVLLISRVWFGYLGFLTGMILAMVGASFILSRLREPVSSISGNGSLGTLSISSASPGLVLAALGVGLMIASTITQRPIEVNDGPLYLNAWSAAQSAGSADSDDKILNDVSKKLEKVQKSNK
jgi:hypothetical protein